MLHVLFACYYVFVCTFFLLLLLSFFFFFFWGGGGGILLFYLFKKLTSGVMCFLSMSPNYVRMLCVPRPVEDDLNFNRPFLCLVVISFTLGK